MSGLGNPLGPFLICCGSGSEPKLYWQVDNDEILCTTETTKASKFHVYIKQGNKQFHIVHPESMKTVTVQRKNIFDRKTKPLKLVQISTPRVMYLKLQHCNATNKSVAVPQTAIAWEEKSPFFIKFSKSFFSRYIAAIECYIGNTATKNDVGLNEKSKMIENGNPQPKHKLVSCAATKYDGSDLKLMPLHFKPAVSSKLPAPVTLKGVRMARHCCLSLPQSKSFDNSNLSADGGESNNSSVSSQLENKSTTNAESDDSTSPQNVSCIESDCSSLPTPTDQPYAENDSSTSHASEDYPNEIAFFELVGDEYDFPLDIRRIALITLVSIGIHAATITTVSYTFL